MVTRSLPLAIVAVIVNVGISAQRGVPPPGDPYPKQPLPVERVQEWSRAVWSHESGLLDPAVVQISRWTAPELYLLFSELRNGLPQFLRNTRVSRTSFDGHLYPEPRKKPTLIYMLEIRSENDEDVNRLLKRAALLHTDIADLLTSPPEFPSLPSPFSGRVTFLAKDGQRVGLAGSGVHLEFVSWLLDGVRPDPSEDAIVQQWYEAASAGLQAGHRVGDAEWLLRRGLGVAPADPRLHFYYGTAQETLSSPRIQSAMPQQSGWTSGNPQQDRLEQADKSHRRALQLSPGFAEARLHLGRVIGKLGRHRDAVRELSEAEAGLADRVLQYYCALFLGQERVLLGDDAAAQLSFARARELYPMAQSPLLALADVAQRTGDSAGALDALRQLLALPAADDNRFDPWWRYDDAHVRDARTRLNAWRTTVAGETSR